MHERSLSIKLPKNPNNSHKWMDGWMNGWMNEWMDGCASFKLDIISVINSQKYNKRFSNNFMRIA